MKSLLVCLILFATTAFGQYASTDKILSKAYSSHTQVCTATGVDASNANVAGPFTEGWYEIYGFTSATDFTGVGIECLQGATNAVTVASKNGTQIPAGSHVIWYFRSVSDYISCQTGSGTGFYHVCPLD